jgi:hypothetical protein
MRFCEMFEALEQSVYCLWGINTYLNAAFCLAVMLFIDAMEAPPLDPFFGEADANMTASSNVSTRRDL